MNYVLSKSRAFVFVISPVKTIIAVDIAAQVNYNTANLIIRLRQHWDAKTILGRKSAIKNEFCPLQIQGFCFRQLVSENFIAVEIAADVNYNTANLIMQSTNILLMR